MTEVVPRWEWRSFAPGFGGAESLILAGEQTRAVESGEVYVLSRRSDVNVKIREGVLNVKVLLQTNDHGLERWSPVLKALLPLEPDTVAQVLRFLHVSQRRGVDCCVNLDRFVDKIVLPNPDLAAVLVTKRRSCHSVNGCKAEVADLSVDGVPIRTVAVEHEDPRRVIVTVHMLGLADRENVNYVRGLKRLKGWDA